VLGGLWFVVCGYARKIHKPVTFASGYQDRRMISRSDNEELRRCVKMTWRFLFSCETRRLGKTQTVLAIGQYD